ncbi:uncharacterized protein V1510DRAFT_367043, partial [Dipodascopsis tothii]|uniref:uncharacterized protein n=1 Tax=Dipodascopsis tothii TaxID=44089 RepID=UPI0034CDA95B
ALGLAPPADFKGLADGAVLSELLAALDGDAFGTATPRSPTVSSPPSFVSRFHSLKRLHKALATYYTDQLGLAYPPESSALAQLIVPNVSLVAKDAAVDEIGRLARMALFGAARAPQPQFREAVQQLSPAEAAELGAVIDQIARGYAETAVAPAAPAPAAWEFADELASMAAKFAPLEARLQDSVEQNTALRDENAEHKRELARLQEQLRQSQALAKAQADVAEKKSRTQIEYLQKDIHELEEQLLAKDRKAAASEREMEALGQQVFRLQEEADAALRLKDRLDESRHELERLQKQAAVADRYRQQLEQTSDLQGVCDRLRDENAYLSEKVRGFEADAAEVYALRKAAERAQTRTDELVADVARLEAEKAELGRANGALRERLDLLAAESDSGLTRALSREPEAAASGTLADLLADADGEFLEPTREQL